MRILGIETSCDDTCAAVIEANGTLLRPQFRVHSNIISSQTKIHAAFGGVVPSLAAREHAKNFVPVVKKALHDSGYRLQDLGLIAVTTHPGLMPALVVGVHSARTLAWLYKKPIIGVNHLAGHAASILLPQKNAISHMPYATSFPAVGLIVSGGHTQLVLMRELEKMRVIGETRDDAAGEAFDKIARLLKLPYPGGPAIAAQAAKAATFNVQRSTFHAVLPRPMINSKDLDLSFSGLKTAVLYLLRDTKRDKRRISLPYLCAEIENAITDVLVAKTLRAAHQYRAKTVFLSGGVAANQTLRKKLEQTIEQKLLNTSFQAPLMEYTTDNAAMIAAASFIQWKCMSPPQQRNATWKRVRIPTF